MIRCSRKHLEQRCEQRGYSLDAAKACIVEDDGGEWITVDETHPAYPHKRPGLGDYVKAGLSAIGITPERVSKVIGKPCGCEQRRKRLNALGRKIGIG